MSFSAHVGLCMAERIAGKPNKVFDLPIYKMPLEYPNAFNLVRSQALAPFRRLGQRTLYRWYALRDEIL